MKIKVKNRNQNKFIKGNDQFQEPLSNEVCYDHCSLQKWIMNLHRVIHSVWIWKIALKLRKIEDALGCALEFGSAKQGSGICLCIKSGQSSKSND